MKTVSIHDAKTNLSKYINAAKQGEKIYIGSFGKPEVMLTVLTSAHAKSIKPTKRQLGAGKAKISLSDDAFSEETDIEIADMMYGDGKL